MMENKIDIEIKAMERAIELAKLGIGHVSPNPRVGAVILKDNIIVSEGWHEKFGEPHAEVNAINNAKGIDLEGATIVVNLEPCSHTGKTPPCADLIIEKKFAKVVIGMKDPNPLVAGKGIQKLEDAGIKVICGVLEKESQQLNRFFAKHITSGLPFIIMKVAQSLNGNIATFEGESQWITSEESRKYTHKLRAEVDAVLAGRNTVQKDNPQLNVRYVKGRNPKRIIPDSKLSLPLNSKIFSDEGKNDTIVCCLSDYSESKKAENLKSKGINILSSNIDNEGRIDLNDCLIKLSTNYNIASILVEGGAEIFSSFVKLKLIDELHIFIAPMIIGNGKSAFEGLYTEKLKDAFNFDIQTVKMSDRDIHIVMK